MMALPNLTRLADYTQLAADAARARFALSSASRSRAQRHIADRLGRMRGLPQKMGQLLSLCDMTEECTADYAALQDSAEPLPWCNLVPVLEKQWGRRVSAITHAVDPRGHAASLGQVHRVTLHNGHDVAVKVQYPGIREALDSDLAMLGWLTKPIGGLQRGFDLERYRSTLRESLLHELDYSREAAEQRRFASDWHGDDQVVIPAVFDELSTAKVLTTRWETADRFTHVLANWSPECKTRLASLLVRFFLQSLFRHGAVHADWHPGNFRFHSTDQGLKLVVYDFGCVWRPSAIERTALREFLTSGETPDVAWNALLTLGFDRSALAPLAGRLSALSQVLSEPFKSTRPFDPSQWNLGSRVTEILGDDRWNFRIAAPPSLMFLMRTLHGLLKFLTDLTAPVAWRPLFEEAIARETHTISRTAFSLPPVTCTTLKIRVTANGQTKVQLSFPATALERIGDLMPEEISGRIADSGINLPALAISAQSRNYAAGPICECLFGDKKVRLWLE
jgi:predicted unusual protein kinase regulating ubiquinone biosynthesis (AarF/ABC1/UbiB family)